MDDGAGSTVKERVRAVENADGPALDRFDDGPSITGQLAVLPGAFNPPTRAHLQMLERCAEVCAGTPVALLTTRNVAKVEHGASHVQRIEMLLAARAALPALVVMACNRARIIDQAALLRAAFPGVEVAMIVGYDTLVRLFDPTYYEDMERELRAFFRENRVMATNRGGDSIADVEALIRREALQFADRIMVVEIDEQHAALSSTAAREEGPGTDVAESALVPEVAAYVRRHRLYRHGD